MGNSGRRQESWEGRATKARLLLSLLLAQSPGMVVVKPSAPENSLPGLVLSRDGTQRAPLRPQSVPGLGWWYWR